MQLKQTNKQMKISNKQTHKRRYQSNKQTHKNGTMSTKCMPMGFLDARTKHRLVDFFYIWVDKYRFILVLLFLCLNVKSDSIQNCC